MDIEEWDTLPEYLKDRINEGLAQAEAGLGTPASEVIKRLREKYGLLSKSDSDNDIDQQEQAEIDEGLKQANRGEVISHEEAMAKYQKYRSK